MAGVAAAACDGLATCGVVDAVLSLGLTFGWMAGVVAFGVVAGCVTCVDGAGAFPFGAACGWVADTAHAGGLVARFGLLKSTATGGGGGVRPRCEAPGVVFSLPLPLPFSASCVISLRRF